MPAGLYGPAVGCALVLRPHKGAYGIQPLLPGPVKGRYVLLLDR